MDDGAHADKKKKEKKGYISAPDLIWIVRQHAEKRATTTTVPAVQAAATTCW